MRPYLKFNNKPTYVDGLRFDSKKEAKRWGELLLLKRNREIFNLDRQVRIPLAVNNIRIGHYVADFVYSTVEGEKAYVKNTNGEIEFFEWTVVEDSKGMKTPLFKWKSKHFSAQYGFNILCS